MNIMGRNRHRLEVYSAVFVLLVTVLEGMRIEQLSEMHKDATSITIEWRTTTSGNGGGDSAESDWIGFKIKYFTEKLQYAPILLKNPNLKKFRLDNLKSNTEYRIQVSAYSARDTEGPASELLVVRTSEAVPGEPQDLKVVRVTSNSIDLEWKAPKRDEQSASSNSIKGYEIHYFKVNQSSTLDGGKSMSQHQSEHQSSQQETQIFKRKTSDVKKLKYTLSELEANTLYKIQIFAYNKRGDGQRSSPLLAQTLDEGPPRPQNIRSEIHNDVLIIHWEPPMSTASSRIDGYLIHFEREKFELNSNANQITFQRPKWDYDRQYEFRIAAKSGATSASGSIYGQEAIYHISTHTNQSKIVIQLEKLTSRSVLIRWNAVHFSSSGNSRQQSIGPVSYKLEYWSKSEPNRVSTHDRLNATELQLSQLRPSTDYIVQIVAFGGSQTSEVSTKNFRTLANDLESPSNLRVVRFEADKISIKWSPVIGVKAYRIYFKELGSGGDEATDDADEDEGGYELEGSDEWRVIEQAADRPTETILEDLALNRDYAVKLTAVDTANNEGPESDYEIAYRIGAPPSSSSPIRNLNEPYTPGVGDMGHERFSSGTISDRVPSPLDVDIIEFTSTSVKFSWMPPSTQAGAMPIRSFLVSYVDRPKTYREANGTLVTFFKGIVMSIKVPARDDPTIKITWLVTGLSPYTEYDFNISSIAYSQQHGELHSHPMRRQVKTRPARPHRVEAPQVGDTYSDDTVLMHLGNASARNGPISKYWLVIVPIDPIREAAKLPTPTASPLSGASSPGSGQQQPNELGDLQALVKYSFLNTSVSNESAYITAEFATEYWPQNFIVGYGETVKYGRFVNRRLSPNVEYKAFIVAFTHDSISEQPIAGGSTKPPNMLLLADVVQQQQQRGNTPLSSAAGQHLESGDLFTYSPYSKTFKTRSYMHAHPDRMASGVSSHLPGIDVYNALWVVGVVFAFIFVVIMIIFLSVRYMQKRNKGNQSAAASLQQQQQQRLLMHGNGGHSTLMRQQQNGGVVINANGNLSAASSTSTTANLMGNGKSSLVEAHLTKNGQIQNTLLRSAVQNNSNAPQKSASSQMFELTQTSNHQAIISSSSSSSSTTASPTTALLSCSVNNAHHMHHNGSQSSSNTNTTNTNNTGGMLAAAGGLLTTASPLKPSGGGFQPAPMQESLYTSIEATQKLLLQQQMNNSANQYDNHLLSLNAMSMYMNNTVAANNSIHNGTTNSNNNNTNSTFTALGTLNRSNNNNGTTTTTRMLNMHHQSQFSVPAHYDPIEYRRIHYPTSSLAAHPSVHVDDLFQHIDRLKAHSNALFSLEYESIEPGQQFTWETAIADSNRQKNRYANVIAYDHSRVILSRLVDDSSMSMPVTSTSDYINASFCDGHRKSAAYIATQGPLPSTYGDFWRMVWEQGSSTIVMMTKLEERQRLKCDQYWPSKGTEIFDNCMQVTLVEHTELAAYSIRTFVIAPVNTYAQLQITANANNMNFEMRREIKHFQFTAWPDHGVPDHPTQLLMFVRRVRYANPPDAGPVVVHCSAGVGRTGCFIVIDTMLERLRNGDKTVDIYGHVTCLRAQRNYMVQTEEQYIFCYDAVLEASQSGETDVEARTLIGHFQQLLQPAPSSVTSSVMDDSVVTPLTEMEIEYKRLSNVKAPSSKFLAAHLPANKFKNRLVNILPYDATRVVLQCLPNQPESAGSDYINANFVDGYRYKHAYIATQAPLQETIDDFWRMLWEHNSTIVVMLTKLREMGREKCVQYWPVNKSIRYQYFVVDPVNEFDMSSYILREFKVTDARDGQSRTIRQFQFIDWPEQGVPKSGEPIIDLIGQVHRTKEQFGQMGPITVHCSAGVGRTGVFITLSIALERMRYEDHVDIYNTVKLLRNQRPAMVQTEDQYQFCYKAIIQYLGEIE